MRYSSLTKKMSQLINNLTHGSQLNKDKIKEQLKLSKQLRVWMKEIGDCNFSEID